MAVPIGTGAKLVIEALPRYPDASHSALARVLYGRNPECWPNQNACRTMVRRYRGCHGGKRHQPAVKATADHWHTAEQAEARRLHPFRAPLSRAEPWEPMALPGKSILVMADIHLPYHDAQALEAVVAWGQRRAVDTVVLLGDVLDCHRLSKFEPDPRARTFAQEIETARETFAALAGAFPGASIVYKLGNHDERYEAYLYAKAPELYGLQEVTFAHLFRDSPVTLCGLKRRLSVGPHLSLIHGHEYGGNAVASPVNPARGLFLRAKACAMCAHQHQSSTHEESTIDGRAIATWSLGCLCDLHPQYRPLNRWGHGAAHIAVDGDGWFEVLNVRVIKGRVV